MLNRVVFFFSGGASIASAEEADSLDFFLEDFFFFLEDFFFFLEDFFFLDGFFFFFFFFFFFCCSAESACTNPASEMGRTPIRIRHTNSLFMNLMKSYSRITD
ncbi:MAG TPA: hypothetical protein EYO18_08400 [Candidatus Marinimicrobia bacterium]|nr:hypothetical protein [Deltaproteobacteria bacterium]HIB05725.1 hypothetical protein [Candidatus Neomarinimicrobiota bacterium]